MPFRCNVSSSIFQKKLQQAIEGLEGIQCVADYIILYGVGCSDYESVADHDTKLQALLQRCRDEGFRLNNIEDQTAANVTNVPRTPDHGQRIEARPEKVKAIEAMLAFSGSTES